MNSDKTGEQRVSGVPLGVRLREHVHRLGVYSPGSSTGVPDGVPTIKLSSNEGADPPVEEVLRALEQDASELHRYPDANDLIALLAEQNDLPIDEVTVGPGADGLLGYLAQAFLGPGDDVVFAWPSFVTYPLTAAKQGAHAIHVPLRDLTHDLDALRDAITPNTSLVYVCNPNNPTGTFVDRDALRAFIESLPAHVVCVVDEAYSEYVQEDDYPHSIDEFVRPGNQRVVVLRTFSKIHGLAGLRVGWMAAPAWIVNAVGRVRGPFDVNAAAVTAAFASAHAGETIIRRAAATATRRESLREKLVAAGLPRPTGVANFLCVDVGDAEVASAALLERGVIVRPLNAFGSPQHVRITIGSDDDMRQAEPIIIDVLSRLSAD